MQPLVWFFSLFSASCARYNLCGHLFKNQDNSIFVNVIVCIFNNGVIAINLLTLFRLALMFAGICLTLVQLCIMLLYDMTEKFRKSLMVW